MRRRGDALRLAVTLALLAALAATAACSDGEQGAKAQASGGPPGTSTQATTSGTATTTGTTTALTPPPLPAAAELDALNEPELRWLRNYAGWRAATFGPLSQVARIRDRWAIILLDPSYRNRPLARYRRALPAASRCGPTLARDVGRPPGPRFAAALVHLEESCRLFARAAAADRKAIAAHDGDGFAADGSDWSDAFLEAGNGDAAVRAVLSENRRLRTLRGPSRISRVDPVYTRVATELVLLEQQVRCWSARDWPAILREENAYTNDVSGRDFIGLFGRDDRVHLSPEVCRGLDVLAYSRARPTSGEALFDVAQGIGTLSHEAEHRAGTWNEAETECRGMQRIRQAARLLGALPSYAALLAETYWTTVYPHKPPAYRTGACRDGGPLDLHPASPVWP
ncbi:MAG TPA: hypothetical protein VH306_00965 [Gaiellaceae bacterium]|jgi:hypothetical protein